MTSPRNQPASPRCERVIAEISFWIILWVILWAVMWVAQGYADRAGLGDLPGGTAALHCVRVVPGFLHGLARLGAALGDELARIGRPGGG